MNAKEEFLKTVDGYNIICAKVGFIESTDEVEKYILLKKGYTQEDFQKFLKQIDKEYDDGYGSLELDGTIWADTGIWFTRTEYDGSEWWEKHQYPTISEDLL